jgi:hypothetical protein
MKKLLIVACILVCGCMTKQRHIEGTHLALGAYIPASDALYGVELLQYTNGAIFSTATNTPCTFERDYVATNTYFWGMVETRETTKTKIEVRK